MSGLPPVRYSDAELALLLRKAAELERRSKAPRDRGGFTLDDLRQIGAEVGISPAVMDEATSQLAMEKRGWWERVIRRPTRFFDERTVPEELSSEQVARIVGRVRRITRQQGSVERVLGAVEWKSDSGFAPLHIRIHSGAGRTRIEALEDLRSQSQVVVGLLGPAIGLGGGTIASVLLSLGQSLPTLGLIVGATSISTLSAWTAWKRWAERVRERRERLMTHLGAEAHRLVRTKDEEDR